MPFNSRNIIILLFALFSALDFPESPITSEKLIMKEKLDDMLDEKKYTKTDVKSKKKNYWIFLNSFDISEAEEVELVDEEENYACPVKEMICDVDDISGEYKRAAVEYWRNGELKPRTINSVKSRFRKVKDNCDDGKNKLI